MILPYIAEESISHFRNDFIKTIFTKEKTKDHFNSNKRIEVFIYYSEVFIKAMKNKQIEI